MALPTAGRTRSLAELERQCDMLRQQQERSQRALEILYNVSLVCRDQTSFQAIFTAIYHALRAVFPLDACTIALCAPGESGKFQAALLTESGQITYVEHIAYGGLVEQILRQHEPLLIHDLLPQEAVSALPTAANPTGAPHPRSWLGVPLLVGSDTVGVITIQSQQANRYDEHDRDLLQHVGNVVAVAIENARLSQQQQELSTALSNQVAARTQELAALSAIAAQMVVQQPLPFLLDRVLALILELLHLDGGNVRILDELDESLVLIAQRGFSAEYAAATIRVPLEQSPLRSVITTGQPLVIGKNWANQPRPTNFPLHLFPRFDALLSVPLRIGERVLGTLSLFGLNAHNFDAGAISLAQAIGNQIAIAIQNVRLFEERERQIAELRALSSISRAASTALDPQTLLRQVHDALYAFLRLDAFSMVIYDAERQVITDGLSIDEGEEYVYWSNTQPPPDSLTAWIIRHRSPLRFNNLAAEIVRYPELTQYNVGSQRSAVSWLGVPFFDRDDQVIGVVMVQGYTPGLFTERDEAFLSDVVQQVALHVQNVRLLTQRERQIRELDAIGQIGKLISASYDLDEMLTMVYQAIAQVTNASVFYLLICEPESHIVTNAIFYEEGQPVTLPLYQQAPDPDSLSAWIIQHCQPLLFQDLPAQRDQLIAEHITPHAVGPANPVRSWAGVPLLAKDGEPIGVLSVQDYQPYRYDAQTIEFLNQVASHVSLGVQKVRLFEERERQLHANARLFAEAQAHAEAAERQAKRMELVHRITSMLSTRLDQQEILELAARELVRLFWADHTGTVLFDHDLQWGTVVAEYPPRDVLGVRVPLTNNLLFAELLLTRRPVYITAIEQDPRAAASRETFQQLGITSLVIVPLISRDQIIGSISLDSFSTDRTFSAEEQDLFLTVATSIATAFENARLFSAEQEARRTADTLREIARVLSASFDPQEVLQLILRELQHLIAYDTASIMLLEGNLLRIAASRGWHNPSNNAPARVLPLSQQSGAGRVVQTCQPLVIADTRSIDHWQLDAQPSLTRSWLGVPLIAKGSVLGVLNIDSHLPNRFSGRDVEVVSAFANQAAIALEKARLYQESVTRVEQEMEIARHIQHNLFPRLLPQVAGLHIAAECLPARETGGDFYDLVTLGDRRIAVMVGDVSGKSIPAAMLMAVARSTARSEARNHETPAEVMQETNRWLVGDVPPYTFVALCYAMLDLDQHQISLANAGQLTPLRRRADGRVEYLQTPDPALPLGMIPDINYAATELPLDPGDTLIFYTDGIVEAKDRNRQLFGFERFEQLVYEYGSLPPDQFIAHVVQAVSTFASGMPQHDDITLVVLHLE